jgi:ClpP class serine protease
MSANEALNAGLIDGIGTFQNVIEKEYPNAKVKYIL